MRVMCVDGDFSPNFVQKQAKSPKITAWREKSIHY